MGISRETLTVPSRALLALMFTVCPENRWVLTTWRGDATVRLRAFIDIVDAAQGVPRKRASSTRTRRGSHRAIPGDDREVSRRYRVLRVADQPLMQDAVDQRHGGDHYQSGSGLERNQKR